MASGTLELSVELEVSPGVWLELEDEANGLSIGSNSFTEQAIEMRADVVGDESKITEGSLTLRAVKANIVETLEVYIEGDTHYDFATKKQQIEDALLTQLTFRIRRTIGDWRKTWDCQPAVGYRLMTSQPMLFAKTGMISAQVPHLPSIVTEQV